MFTGDASTFFVGSTVTAVIVTQERTGVTQVPIQAVTTNGGTSTVTVALAGKTDGPTETRTVVTGATANGMVEITSGLKVGESVIVLTRSLAAGTGGQGPAGTGSIPNRTGVGGGRTGGQPPTGGQRAGRGSGAVGATGQGGS
jgi:hypothetical protein